MVYVHSKAGNESEAHLHVSILMVAASTSASSYRKKQLEAISWGKSLFFDMKTNEEVAYELVAKCDSDVLIWHNNNMHFLLCVTTLSLFILTICRALPYPRSAAPASVDRDSPGLYNTWPRKCAPCVYRPADADADTR